MSPDDSRDRIERLVASGSLPRAEADQLLETLERLQDRARRVGAGSPPKPPSRSALTKLAFLRGEIAPEDLLRIQKRAAALGGLVFGVLTASIHTFVLEMAVDGHSFGRALLVGLPHLVLGGPLFGWALYRFFLRPSAERLARLVRSSGAPLEPSAFTPAGRCPTCAAENFKVWGKRHPVMLHWVWNPGLAFNELFLGQRVPERLSNCLECGTSWVDCPGCERAVDAALWSARDSFGQWRGLPCPHCGHRIPCLRNVWAGLLLLPLRLLGVGRRPTARTSG